VPAASEEREAKQERRISPRRGNTGNRACRSGACAITDRTNACLPRSAVLPIDRSNPRSIDRHDLSVATS
jgi:hypothetical protein